MKYIILFLSFNLMAANWMSEEHIQRVKDNVYPQSRYTSEGKCNVAQTTKCWQIDGLDPVTHTIQDVEVDDTDKPIYAERTNETTCIIWEYVDGEEPPANNCGTLTATVNVGTEEAPIYEPSLCTDKTYFATYEAQGEGYVAYCSKLLGYDKKMVKKLLEDAALVSAKEAEEAAKEAEKLAKEQEKAELEASMDTCLALDPEVAKDKDIAECMIPVLNYIRKHLNE